MDNVIYIEPINLSKKEDLLNIKSSLPSKQFSLKYNNSTLKGRILFKNKNKDISDKHLIAIHGAKSDYYSLDSILFPLQKMGISSLCFNLSGHKENLRINDKLYSLKGNLEESLFLLKSEKIVIKNLLGFSLGGALALKIAEIHKSSVKRIILFAPAIYTEKAYKVSFGSSFKETISKPSSFLDSESFSFLKTFRGKVLLIIGEYDGLPNMNFNSSLGTSVGHFTYKNKEYYSPIPYEVIYTLEKSINSDNFFKIILKECDHSIMKWLNEYPDAADKLTKEIISFLN